MTKAEQDYWKKRCNAAEAYLNEIHHGDGTNKSKTYSEWVQSKELEPTPSQPTRTPTNKEYDLETIQDICNVVTAENLDDFIADFKESLNMIIQVKNNASILLKASGQNVTDEMMNEMVKVGKIGWIDDGKTYTPDQEMSLTIAPKP
ncbi:hypothetical protein V6R21_17775 [Limibacter armeniacum]|uniref:hypothetical protein n=1 Tax=Limibacter armeniacum TaxID=466084 RepID=UPI002FE5C972